MNIYTRNRQASMRGWRLSRRSFISASAAAIFSASCSRDNVSSLQGSTARSQLTFVPTIPLTSLTWAAELLADAAGYFADQQLDVIFEPVQGSAPAMQLIIAGQAQLTRITYIEGMIAAANRGIPIVNVGTSIKRSTIRFISSSENPLRNPEDFVGKTVGIPSEGGSSEVELDLYLAAAGVDRASVKRQVVGLTPGVFDLVARGRIAGYTVGLDTSKILKQQRADSIVVLDPGRITSSGGHFYMTSENGLMQAREAIGKFVKGVHAAIEYIINDDGFDKTLAILRSKYSFDALNDTNIAKDSLSEYLSSWLAGGKENILLTDPVAWAKSYAELVGVGLVPTGEMPERWLTNEFVEEAVTVE